jgi:pimeloyl-ACP methyl ester carboxylesterase
LKISKVVSISGSPGLPENDLQKRKERLKEDAERAEKLRNQGLENFLAAWYSAPMWDTLTRDHTHVFTRILETRKRGLLSQNLDLSSLSLTLEIMSPGRAPDVQPELYRLSSQGKLPQMLLVAGKQDAKFVDIANTLAQDLPQNAQSQTVEAVVVENCGHTVHVEQPIRLLTILFDFISSHIE